METLTQNVLVVIAAVALALLFLVALNRTWPSENRHKYNDLLGWQVSILSTTYAVILGFMLYAVWTTYGEADRNVDHEANAVADLYRLAEGFPEPQQSQLKNLARSYAEVVVNREWPEMANNEEPKQRDVGLRHEKPDDARADDFASAVPVGCPRVLIVPRVAESADATE